MSNSKTITLQRDLVGAVIAIITDSETSAGQQFIKECWAVDILVEAMKQPDASITTSVPAGWKLVPVGPNVEMMDAGGAATRRCYQHLNKDEVMCSYVYRHMLAASPQPPALGRPQSNTPTPYLWYDPKNGDTWTQEAIDEGFCATDSLIPLYTKGTE